MTLLSEATAIRDATATNYNTATRVGGLLVELVNGMPCIHVATYGALTTDLVGAINFAAITAAMAAGAAAGIPVTGSGLTYGVVGNLVFPDGVMLQDITLKQLAPGAAGDVRTLTSAGGNNIKLRRVKVNRNGNGTNGALATDAGIYISGGSGHYFEDVEVYGDDMGSGFAIVGATDFEMVRTYVHDIKYLLGADPGDDRVQGVWFVSCSSFSHTDTRVNTLGGNFGAGATQRWSRGVVYGDCHDFTVVNPRIWDVDQGHDVTGGPAANERFSVTGGLARDCKTYGFKFANTARDGKITGVTAERCGLACFEVSGGPDLATNTCDLEFDGCVAYDAGSNGFWANARGFDVQENAATIGATRGIRFINCKAHDRQSVPTMARGFTNDTAANADGRYNEVINCRSIGHTIEPFLNFNQGRVELARTAIGVASGAWTLVAWDSETDYGAMYAPPSGQVFARRAGNYQAAVGITFAANAVGQRGVRLVGAGGTPIPGASLLVNAAAAGTTELSLNWPKKMLAGDEIRVEVWQSSGGALNIQSTSTAVVQQVL